MSEYIEREELLKTTHNYYPSIDHYCTSVKCVTVKEIKDAPAADVVPISEIFDAVYEALRVLDAVRLKVTMEYDDYSDLHYAISAICIGSEQEAHNG